MKLCTKCGVEKGSSEFGRDKRHSDGLQSACRACQSAATRARSAQDPKRNQDRVRTWRAEHPEQKLATDRAWREQNRERRRANWARWKREHPEAQDRLERRYLLRKYGLTEDAFLAMLEAQEYACARCGAPEPGGRGTWHVDHDHNCCPASKRSCGKCVNGLLCARCNLNREKWDAA
jgi:hypothetical protein